MSISYSNFLTQIRNYTEVDSQVLTDSIISEFAEFKDEPTETIYPYVPIDIVEALLEKHGGIDAERTLQ